MNQGIAFARTLRALDADDFRGSKLGFVIAAILLGTWTWWMLAARVPQYESTTNVRIESGRAIAYFPSTSQIHLGQSALVTLGSDAIPARVQEIADDHVELVFSNPQSPIPTSTRAAARVEISSLSPAAIALRTIGRGSR